MAGAGRLSRLPRQHKEVHVKLEHVSIKGFLGIEALDLNLKAPINLFVGENEAGKSSRREAIQWVVAFLKQNQ
jgi:predicted ATP-dependent endonuclease of OLD family